MRTQAFRGALEALDRILNRGGDADELLRAVVALLHDRLGYSWVGISFVEGDGLVLGPSQGRSAPTRIALPISFEGSVVGELAVESEALDDDDRRCLERVALLVSPYCLVGWDTGGVPWAQVGDK